MPSWGTDLETISLLLLIIDWVCLCLFIVMEHKQLNFDRPILSVRRYSTAATTTTTPSVKTEKCRTDTSFPSFPHLPYYRSDLKSGPVSNPGTVPFTWERSPGRPKHDDANHPHFKNHSVAPKLPPGWTLKKQAPSSRINEDLDGSNQEDKFEESKDNERISNSDSVSNCDSNGVHDEVYLDALDTLSRTESYFLNCSNMSGLSEKPAGAFSADPQTRDFMMGRFLPAAKAMAAEIPQSSKKQNFPPSRKEKEKPVPVVRPKSSNVRAYMEYHKEVEVDEEDDYYDEPENMPNKACGLLPRFCLKGSFCILNPVPGMSMRTRVPMSPVSSVQTRALAAAGLCSKSEDQPSGCKGRHSGAMDPGFELVRQQYLPTSEVSTYERKPVGASEQNESHIKLDGSPQPSFSDSEEFPGAMDFHSGEKKLSSLQELFAYPSSSCSEEAGIITNLTVEKTVYVDSVHKMADTKPKPKSKSCSSDEEIPKSLKEDDTHSLNDREEDSNNDIKKSTDQPQSLERPTAEDHSYSRKSTFSANTKTQSHSKQELLPDTKTTSRFNPEFPLPPPLPKSPSDSWLCQALPAISKSSLSWKNHLASQTDCLKFHQLIPSGRHL